MVLKQQRKRKKNVEENGGKINTAHARTMLNYKNKQSQEEKKRLVG